MHADDEQFLAEFFRQVPDDLFLQPADPRHVDLGGEGSDPLEQIQRAIRWTEPSISTLHLFSGFRGSGKTTRLLELRETLRAAGHAVLYVNIEDVLDIRTPVDPGSFLIALTAAVEAAAAGDGGDPNDDTSYVDGDGVGRWWTRAKSLLEATSENYKLGLKLGPVTIAAELRENPSFVEQVRRAAEVNLAEFRKEAHDHIAETAERIKETLDASDKKVVLIVDSLDHADHRLRFDEIKNALYELFVTHRELLSLAGVQCVYTVPPYLKFLQAGGTSVLMHRNVKVRERDGSDAGPGIAALRELVRRRGDAARLLGDPHDLCGGHLDRLILASGGHLRDLLRLVRQILTTTETVPADAATIERAVRDIANTLLPLADDEVAWLQRVKSTHAVGLEHADAWGRLAGLFDRHLVLGYVNGDEWYGVHPLVEPLL